MVNGWYWCGKCNGLVRFGRWVVWVVMFGRWVVWGGVGLVLGGTFGWFTVVVKRPWGS